MEYLIFKRPEKLQQVLEDIFLHYKKQYPKIRFIDLIFYDEQGCSFNWGGGRREHYINMDFIYIENNYDYYDTIERHGNELTPKEFAVVVLLHEIKHCIDFNYDNKNYREETIQMNRAYLRKIRNEEQIKHTDFSMEKRADNFANIEFKKWKKVLSGIRV